MKRFMLGCSLLQLPVGLHYRFSLLISLKSTGHNDRASSEAILHDYQSSLSSVNKAGDGNEALEAQPTPSNGHHVNVERNLSGSAAVSYQYQCTFCRPSRSYKRREDWVKHEKEHEYKYVCILQESPRLLHQSKQGNISGKPALTGYEALKVRGFNCHFNCKRRVHMVSHLKETHGSTEDSHALAIAKDSLRSSGRKFWSCGFCVTLFLSFSDRIKHIAKQHFEVGTTMDDWDVSKVIRGLLSQPLVNEAWNIESGGDTEFSRPEMAWHASNTDRLQSQLEMGASNRHDGYSLAEAAYEASDMGSGSCTQSDLMTPFQSQPLPANYSMLNPIPLGMQMNLVHSPFISQEGQSSSQTAFDTVPEQSTTYQDPRLPFSSGSKLNPTNLRYLDFTDSTIGQTTTTEPQGLDERAHPTEHSFQARNEFDDIMSWDV